MAKLKNLNRWKLIDFIMENCRAEEFKNIMRELKETYVDLRVSGSLEDMANELEDTNITKKEIIEAMANNTVYTGDSDDSVDDEEEDSSTESESEIYAAVRINEKYFKDLLTANLDLEYRRIINNLISDRYSFKKAEADKPVLDYQGKAIQALNSKIGLGYSQWGLVMPTGSGKTFTVSKYAFEEYLSKNNNVIVVAPTWEILSQHAGAYCQRFGIRERIRRIGGRGTLLDHFTELDRSDRGVLILTTPNSGYTRTSEINADLFVLDEAHWGSGDGRKMLPAIVKRAAKLKKPVLHMTATWTESLNKSAPKLVDISFLDLVPEYLASCEVVRLETGESFSPEFSGNHQKLLKQSCIREISGRKERVNKIVSECHRNGYIKGQTMYYAGSIAEAELVFEALSALNYRCGLVHSQMENKKLNPIFIDRFRSGSIQVLINVQQLTMGFDVPEIETIIVARPVESAVLFMQICGRGARKIKGKKESFRIIDVHDSVVGNDEIRRMFEHSHIFDKASRQNSSHSAYGKSYEARSSKLFEYRPDGLINLLSNDFPAHFRGFPYREGQSFGFEIELTWEGFSADDGADRQKCQVLGDKLLGELRSVLGSDKVASRAYSDKAPTKNMELWNVEWDGSAGLEVTTRVLMGEVGILELMKGMEVLQKFRIKEHLRFNHRTGCHLHLGWMANDTEHAEKFIKLWCGLERGLYNILAPSRLYEWDVLFQQYSKRPNPFAMPLNYVLGESIFKNGPGLGLIEAIALYENESKGLDHSRYLSVNLTNVIGRLGTVEFRALQGTDDPMMLVAWLSLCMIILQRSRVVELEKLNSPTQEMPEVGYTGESLKAFLRDQYGVCLPSTSRLYDYIVNVRLPASQHNWSKRAG